MGALAVRISVAARRIWLRQWLRRKSGPAAQLRSYGRSCAALRVTARAPRG